MTSGHIKERKRESYWLDWQKEEPRGSTCTAAALSAADECAGSQIRHLGETYRRDNALADSRSPRGFIDLDFLRSGEVPQAMISHAGKTLESGTSSLPLSGRKGGGPADIHCSYCGRAASSRDTSRLRASPVRMVEMRCSDGEVNLIDDCDESFCKQHCGTCFVKLKVTF